MFESYPDPGFNDRLINPQELPWYYTFSIKTPPQNEAGRYAAPVTLEEVKTFARLDSMDEDELIEAFIQASTQAAEEYLGRALMQQTVVLKMDFFPGIVALLPRFLATSALPVPLARPPLVNVTEVRTLYEDDTTIQTWDLNQFYWLRGDPAQFVIRRGSVPPINVERYRGGFEIEYVAGYGGPTATGSTAAALKSQRAAIPSAIKIGIMQWAAAMYSQRGRAAAADPPADAIPMLSPFKVIRI